MKVGCVSEWKFGFAMEREALAALQACSVEVVGICCPIHVAVDAENVHAAALDLEDISCEQRL